MHEWSLAEAAISTAIKVSKMEKFKEVTELKIKMGELQQIEIEIFEFALKEIVQLQGSILENAEIKIEIERAFLKCRVCGCKWAFSDAIKKLSEGESESIHFIPEVAHVYIRCPKCESSDFEIMKGRGVWLNSIEGMR